MTNNIINGVALEMLAAFEEVLKKLEIDFYLVGALARDIGLWANPSFASKRATKDVDIAILLASEQQFYQVKQALLETGNFTAHETEPIKLFYKNAVELDLLPFGDIENEGREIKLAKPRLFVIDVPGFQEVFPDVEQYTLNNGISLKVCPLEGLILLKLIANDNEPSRTKDITDIEHIISVYFDLKETEIYEEYLDVMDNYGVYQPDYLRVISARVIGRKIANMLDGSDDLRERLLVILDRKTTGLHWPEIAAGIRDIHPQ
ncbi:nucleotidyl transferase AbiEii/AbiGii toxin family protein [Paraflavitalea speifideaquila]|uniref:nucleotidyl transferase AbiEii/AbiGii toxin family protein n=1 Tax=Paraflavitalea speifideaquila TaxID=3076558 RepID=UPI0028E6C2C5|nr:nucleotidyl transferase AbiEii/AbiGii toxin family protein [Paraflavitalea speifideiaquila]